MRTDGRRQLVDIYLPGDLFGLALPISRYDIADILGISAETVCRASTDLQERGVISLQGLRRMISSRHVAVPQD